MAGGVLINLFLRCGTRSCSTIPPVLNKTNDLYFGKNEMSTVMFVNGRSMKEDSTPLFISNCKLFSCSFFVHIHMYVDESIHM